MKIDKYKNVKARKRKKRRYNVYNKNDIWLSVGFFIYRATDNYY